MPSAPPLTARRAAARDQGFDPVLLPALQLQHGQHLRQVSFILPPISSSPQMA